MRLNVPLAESQQTDVQRSFSKVAGSITRCGTRGFTLVEIALAMAIFSFALVSMLGLLSVGLKNSRKSSIQIAASNVLSSIAADIQGASISKSPNGDYTVVSSKLRIKVLVLTTRNGTTEITYPEPLIVNEACSPTNPADGSGLLKTFLVKLSSAEPGVQAIRVEIRWPSNTPDGVQPEGSLYSLVALPSL
jgi:prepilin-type N-terminal cleavage/methylation domain-containing protein